MDEKEQTEDRLTQARGTVLLGMIFSGYMRDDFISPEELETLRTKTYQEWPKELQDKLKSFGAEMIQ